MRILCFAAIAALAAAPAAAQTVVIGPSPAGAEVGPFGSDASYGFTTPLVGQSFLAPGAFLQSFTFFLRNEVGASTTPQFRAFVAEYDPATLTIGAVRFTSGLLTGPSGATFLPLTVAANTALSSGRSYIAYLSGVVSTAGVSYLGTNENAPYANGTLVYDLGGGSLVADDTQDAAFTATFAPAATVPEPGTVLLVAGGLAGLAALTRRRAAKRAA